MSDSYLSDSMKQLGHSSVDVLKINNIIIGIDILKELFEDEILPKIIILPSEMIKRKFDINTNKSVTHKLSTFGYKTLESSF